jgi:hypothetical protein
VGCAAAVAATGVQRSEGQATAIKAVDKQVTAASSRLLLRNMSYLNNPCRVGQSLKVKSGSL